MAGDRKYEVSITANTSQFENALAAAGRAATGTANKIDAAFGNLRSALNSNVSKLLAGLGAVGGATAFVGLIKGSIDAADHLNDLSKSTGIAVDTLGGIGFAAQQSGSDLDETGKAVQRLRLRMAEATAGNEEALKAFRALGLSAADLRGAKLEDVLARVATAFRSFNEDENKGALGFALFKKSYSGIAPLLDEGGDKLRQNVEYFKKFGGVNADAAEKADQFNDTMVKLKLLSGRFGRDLAQELLPSLQTLADRFVELREKGDDFAASDVASVLKGLAGFAIATTTEFTALGRAMGIMAAQAKLIASGDLAGARALEADAVKEQEARFARMRELIDAINNPQPGKTRKPATPSGGRNAPSLGSSDADAAIRRAFDQQIKDLEQLARNEADVLRTREVFLKQSFDDDLLSVKEYTDTRQQFLDEAFAAEAAAYQRAIAVAQDYAAKANPKERADAEAKIADLQDKLLAKQREYSVATVNNFRDSTKAAQAFRDKIEEVAIAVAEARGDTVTAGLAQFDKSNAQFQQQIRAQLQSYDELERREGEIAQQQLDHRREQVKVQLQLNKETENFNTILAEVTNAQGSLDAQRAAGTLTGLQYLQKLSDVNAAQLDRLRQVADVYEQIAQNSEDPRARVAAQALRVEIEKLAASTDLVAKQFQDIFSNALADSLVDVATGVKSVKEAFNDLTRSIAANISRIAANNLADALFKGNGPGAGIGDLFARLFAAFGGGGGLGYGTAGSLIPPGPFPYANGTDFHPGGWALVGERGPELLKLPRGSAVTPNHELARMGGERSITNHININVTGQVDTRTARQIGHEAAAAFNATMARG